MMGNEENDENDSFIANHGNSIQILADCTNSPYEFTLSKFRSRKCTMARSISIDSDSSTPKRMKLKRFNSDNEAIIKKAVESSSQNTFLIGDFSKPYALPLVEGKHNDLKSISPDILANLINGCYKDLIETCTIVDCRFPYEYESGHIIGSKNIYCKEGIIKEFLNFSKKNEESKENEQVKETNPKRHIIVFHCEFSSQRGPTLLRYLRNEDRQSNKDNYPSLHHPEIYLLEGGYKAFYEKYKELCKPQSYLPMHSKNHEHELRHFRAKSKSWNGDGKLYTQKPSRPGFNL